MSDIEDKFNSFKDHATSIKFMEAQQKTIIKLKEENEHLKKLLEKNVPVLIENGNSLIKTDGMLSDHEETICRIELKRLHDISLERALNYEEAKRVDLYSKLLIQINSKPKTIELEARKKPTDELLAIVEDINDRKSN